LEGTHNFLLAVLPNIVLINITMIKVRRLDLIHEKVAHYVTCSSRNAGESRGYTAADFLSLVAYFWFRWSTKVVKISPFLVSTETVMTNLCRQRMNK
jgi:hypothetical protein